MAKWISYVLITVMIVSNANSADGDFQPYVDSNGYYIMAPPTVEGSKSIRDCQISKVSSQFLGDQPICKMEAKCKLFTPTSYVDIKDIEPTFFCLTESATEGCSNLSWQKCAMDKSIPDGFNGNKCLTDSPGSITEGCPKISSNSTSQKATKQKGAQ